jgi:hypothetical protein
MRANSAPGFARVDAVLSQVITGILANAAVRAGEIGWRIMRIIHTEPLPQARMLDVEDHVNI